MLSLDAEKALDSVLSVLYTFGFHQSLIDVMAALYDKPSANIRFINLERGMRQECIVSSLLFALFIELLSQWLRQRPDIQGAVMASGEQRLSLCADHLLLTITNPTKIFTTLMEMIVECGLLSGNKININKIQFLTLNYSRPSKIRSMYGCCWEETP